MTIKTPSAADWRGKKILLRLDLNVPLSRGRIADDFKLRAALPTIRRFRTKAALIIVTHVGNPSSRRETSLSAAPIAAWLKRRLGGKVSFAALDWKNLEQKAAALKPGDILVLENIRFDKGEIPNSNLLAKRLAALADIYVNDAFAVSHRAHASVAAIQRFLPSYAGPLLEAEIRNLERARTGRRPSVIVSGGAKISTKLPLLKAFGSSSMILTGGGVANTLLKAAGYPIGHSLAESKLPAIVSRKIMIPHDVVVLDARNRASVASVKNISAGDSIVDIGPETARAYGKIIAAAKTIIWNGPLGLTEDARARKGTASVAKAIASNRKAFSLIGGGETVASISPALQKKISWISTGGGATLAYLAGLPMPGLKKIIS